MSKIEVTYKCNGCQSIFIISIIESKRIPQDGFFYACCPLCGRTGWKALEQIN